jgi:O-antigen/teichoic acid export membrane protein
VVVATAWLPRFVRAFEESREKLGEVARAPVELVLLLSLPIAAMTAVSAKPLINLLYGHAYAHSVPVMVVLGLCIPPMYLNIIQSQVLIGMNRQAAWTWVMAGTTVINPLFNLALIPLTEHAYGNGAIGAAISLLLTELVCVIAGYVMIGKLMLDWAAVRRTGLGIGIAAAMWGAGYGAGRAAGPVAAIVAAAAAFPLLAVTFRLFTKEEVELLRAGLAKVQRKLPGLRGRAASAAIEALPPA